MIAVIELDGTSRPLLERMLAEGRMPQLAGLLARGTRHELESPGSHFPAGAFQTLYTGLSQGEHGLFYPWQWDPDRQRAVPSSELAAPPAIWERLAAAGRSAVVLDPYESEAPARAPGPMVSGWQFAERTVLPRWSLPNSTWRALRGEIGRPPDVTEVFGRKRVAGLRRLRDRLLLGSERAAAGAERLLAGAGPDLAWIAFSGAHLGGHQLLADEHQLGSLPAAFAEELAAALPAIYESLDRGLGRVLSALPDDADLIVVSVVGMEPNASRADLLPGMLEAVLSGRPLERRDGAGAIWRLRSALPPELRGAASRLLPAPTARRLTARAELRGYDWGRTRAFAHPADNQGYVRFNLAGREAEGTVRPEQAAELAETIRAGLSEFRDPDGGSAVVAVEGAPDLFPGRHSGRLPDLVVRWAQRPANGIRLLTSPRLGEVWRAGEGSGRSGNHPELDCWAILVPGRGGERNPGRPPRLSDVTATALALAGVEGELPGEPLIEA